MGTNLSGAAAPSSVEEEEAMIAETVERAAQLLPEQAPLHAFVHHNTLHAFERLRFEDAVLEAGRRLGAEPYLKEPAFAEYMANGRMRSEDLDVVVAESDCGTDESVIVGALTRAAFRRRRLDLLFEIPRGHLLTFFIQERGSVTSFHRMVADARRERILRSAKRDGERTSEAGILRELWRSLAAVAPARKHRPRGIRRRDELFRATGVDTDEVVHPLLTRLCASFLDQGIAYWPMPERENGFLHAVRKLYGLRAPPPDRLFRGLPAIFRAQEAAGMSALATIRWALGELRVPASDYGLYIEQTLLALRGWAGMMRHLELRPDHAPVTERPTTVIDFLAVRLVLDAVTVGNLEADEKASRRGGCAEDSPCAQEQDLELVFEGFVVAQCLPVELSEFHDPARARAWLAEVRAFGELERRALLQRAFERRHQMEALQAVRACAHAPSPSVVQPLFQAVFCIDDREESTRRHVEEACPTAETFGYPGFFGIAMDFKGADAHKARPLCPAGIRPTHRIVERSEHPAHSDWLARLRLEYHVGRVSLLRGALITAAGALAIVPWLISTLFRGKFGKGRGPCEEPRSVIGYRRDPALGTEDVRSSDLATGYTVDEMVDVVATLLRQTGLAEKGRLSKLLVVVGHGSTSINNPHLAAYGCGATGGGCGGPNARVFAMMANDPDVRARLAERGILIPADCHVLGAYHDTCRDTICWYDEELLPSALTETFSRTKQAFEDGLADNAKERCRLFGTVPLAVEPAAAKREVEVRSEDLSEARPEYNHAKNSLCIVGPRSLTRGLFLDQRAFLVSYEERLDSDGRLLAEVLSGSLPVSVGINLEYYFSSVDSRCYGAGSKLPHNITGLVGVMDGHASDLRTGLYQQMVELHEPVRLTAVVLAPVEKVRLALDRDENLRQLVSNRWCFLIVYNAQDDTFRTLDGNVVDVEEQREPIVWASNSLDGCAMTRGPIRPFLIGRAGSHR